MMTSAAGLFVRQQLLETTAIVFFLPQQVPCYGGIVTYQLSIDHGACMLSQKDRVTVKNVTAILCQRCWFQ
jgi:hypothetical protein